MRFSCGLRFYFQTGFTDQQCGCWSQETSAPKTVQQDCEKQVMSDAAISVMHLCDRDEESLLNTRRQIVSELDSGRDVVLVIDEPVCRRAERMTLATLSFQNADGRFAVVTGDAGQFSELPRVMSERLRLFASQEAALEWLQPGSFDMKQTMLYLSMN